MLLVESLLGSFSAEATYIEDVFSTWLYTGTGASQTITNGINLSGNGGMVWIKSRSASTSNFLFDTARGATKEINSDTTDTEATLTNSLTAFNPTCFTVSSAAGIGVNAATYASWTFRKQPQFFDVVTYTGNGANRIISHRLGSVPGCIMIKRTDTTAAWAVYHRSLANTQYMVLNTTAAAATGATYWNSTTPTSSVFSLGTSTDVNANGGTYVAYLFAHDAGSFGATGTNNVISCGSYTGNASFTGPTVTLGYEPQWLLVKRATGGTADWYLFDTMRGMPTYSQNNIYLVPNSAFNEGSPVTWINPSATGFNITGADANINANGSTYIYIAIRRGPMKTPTTGTSVFGLSARTGTGANVTVTGGQTDDAVLIKRRDVATGGLISSRLTGSTYMTPSSTAVAANTGATILQTNPWDVMDGVKVGTTSTITNASGSTYINYLFRRAPGFFDVMCYVGNGGTNIVNHNLGVSPEMIITKSLSAVDPWQVNFPVQGRYATLNTSDAGFSSTMPVTSTTINVNSNAGNNPGEDYVAYLFATCPGISKIGSYTGTGTTNQINCGFTGGARFVLIKRTNSAGDWYYWDTARGIVAGNDPYLLMNSANEEVTTTDYIDTYSSGFELSSTAPSALNANGSSYIFLAIA